MAAKKEYIIATQEAFARILLAKLVHLETIALVVLAATGTHVPLGLLHHLVQHLAIKFRDDRWW